MSEQVRRTFSLIFIVSLAVIFALQWGPAAKGCDSPNEATSRSDAAIINGKPISQDKFRRAYIQQLDAYKRQSMALTEDMARQLGLPNQVLENIVSQELLAQYAEKQGIATSDAELKEYLLKQEAFKKDGKFDPKTYEAALENFLGQSPVEFETELRKELAAQKVVALLENAVQVSEDEVKTRYFKEYNRATMTFVRFLPSMFQKQLVPPSGDEVKTYAEKNQVALADFYEKNKFRYHQAEQVRARHILMKVPGAATPAQKEEIQKKLLALREQIVGGKDFGAAAKEVSEDLGSKENGGDLGYNERGAWTPKFAEAAFALKAGELSVPVETPFGFHLIKLEDRRAPFTRPLDAVSQEIARELLVKQKTQALAQEAAQKAIKSLKEGKKTLKDLYPPSPDTQKQAMRFETETQPEAVDSNEFNAGTDSLPRLGPAPELLKAVFSLHAPSVLPRPFEVGESFVAAEVTRRELPSDEKYNEQKATLRQEALQARRFDARTEFIKALRKNSNVVLNEVALR